MNSLPGSQDRQEELDQDVVVEQTKKLQAPVGLLTRLSRGAMQKAVIGFAALGMTAAMAGKVEAEDKPGEGDGKAKVVKVVSSNAKKESKEVKKVKWFTSPLKGEDGPEWSPYNEHLKEFEVKLPNGGFRTLKHLGEDHDAEADQEVCVPADGRVFNAGYMAPTPYINQQGQRAYSPSAGGWVMIEHDLGKGRKMYSVFMHIKPDAKLKKGMFVKQGTVFAKVAEESTMENGMQPTRHLHFHIVLDCLKTVQNQRAGVLGDAQPTTPNRPEDTLSPSIMMKQEDPLKFAQETYDFRLQGMLQARR